MESRTQIRGGLSLEHGGSVESKASSQKQVQSSYHLQSSEAWQRQAPVAEPEPVWATCLCVSPASAGAADGEAPGASQTDREKGAREAARRSSHGSATN